MSVAQMRASIEKAYPGEKWKNKVAAMADKEVIAVYYALRDRSKYKKETISR